MNSLLQHRSFSWSFLFAACAMTTLLWLPSIDYPIVSDTSLYALLGESFWTKGAYAVLGELHGKHLPVHAIFSYPLVAAFGYSIGMKLSTLLAGFGVLIASFMLLRRTWSLEIAVWTTIAIVFHHGFIGMTSLGSADLLLTFFFLLTLHCYLSAGSNPRWYLGMGLFLGLACLTRYNLVPLFAFFPFYTLWKRPKHLWNPWFISGMLLGAVLFSLWFIRAFVVLGGFQNDYTEDLTGKSAGLIQQFFINVQYYLHPLRNILPILLVASVYGVWKAGKKQPFLLTSMLAVWSLFAIWPVLNLRYAFPGYIILIAFAVAGLLDALSRLGRSFPAGPRLPVGQGRPALILIMLGLILSHGLALCLYQYGSCNALWERAIDRIPKNLGLAMEGFYTWDQARDYVNRYARQGAQVVVAGKVNAIVMGEGIFRSDLSVVADTPTACPSYEIVYVPADTRLASPATVFQTIDAPTAYVMLQRCAPTSAFAPSIRGATADRPSPSPERGEG
ncbi:glycosyltransferase family 39 protein [Candidatus Peregrinibacteria bacterium]|nr:glycosyltransferase family 39 protein [Candidatus Peregrinibacteria bacterium]